jgi:hypothetical protein
MSITAPALPGSAMSGAVWARAALAAGDSVRALRLIERRLPAMGGRTVPLVIRVRRAWNLAPARA